MKGCVWGAVGLRKVLFHTLSIQNATLDSAVVYILCQSNSRFVLSLLENIYLRFWFFQLLIKSKINSTFFVVCGF